MPIEERGAEEIARRSRGTPRVANRLLRRVRDYAEVRADGRITADVAAAALARLNVDEFGLDDMDARILTTIIEKFGGGPVGLGTVAIAVGEDAGTLQDVYEPYLIRRDSSSAPNEAVAPLLSPTADLDSPHRQFKPPSLTAERFRTADFEYHLPPELIAQEPPPERGGSRLLVVRRETSNGQQELTDAQFADLPGLIPSGDLLVINTTRVRHARLVGIRASGAPAEILLIHPATDDTWIAIGRPGSALRPGRRVTLGPEAAVETVAVLPDGNRLVRFVGITAEGAMSRYGRLPLPPYIERPANQLDESRYQTIYAQAEGSVAAPTAGLHFTPKLLETLTSRGVQVAGLDLQVGTGTFKPVEVEDPVDHEMHPELYDIPDDLAHHVERVKAAGHHVWAVGTTVIRALESAVRSYGKIQAGSAETRLMILPGYQFRVVDHLITNFHLPRSTLLMLVCALAAASWHSGHIVTR